MPFTLSHPAAILPLHRALGRHSVLSAWVVGSIAPDLPYFLGLPWHRATTHTFESLIWFSLPAGWVAWLLFEHALRAPAISLLPRSWRVRLRLTPARLQPMAVSLALVVGAATHVVWDAATHADGAIVAGLPFLAEPWLGWGERPLAGHRLLQHGSTLIGAAALALAVTRWRFRSAPQAAEPCGLYLAAARSRLRRALLVLPLLFGLGFASATAPPRASTASPSDVGAQLGDFVAAGVVSTLSAGGFGLLWLGLAARARGAVRAARRPRSPS